MANEREASREKVTHVNTPRPWIKEESTNPTNPTPPVSVDMTDPDMEAVD
jgi:hypothetical protein